MNGIILFLTTNYIIPALQEMGADSPSARVILAGTALEESNILYARQIGMGPAKGFFQMEDFTHNDCWENFLKYRQNLASKMLPGFDLSSGKIPNPLMLMFDVKYAAKMCRIKYMRDPSPLPEATDALGMDTLHKTFYNSAKGASNIAQDENKFQLVIDVLKENNLI